MIQIDDTIVSLDLLNEYFCCDLSVCKGVCCVDGDAGAPLEKGEVEVLEQILPAVIEYLPEKSRKTIENQGVAYIDSEGDEVTTLVNDCECAFAFTDENGCMKCAIEKSYKAGKISFYKPVSCHLYPVRLHQYENFTAVNYHQWHACACARALGKAKKLPVYKFLKEPLIRRFGNEWYAQLEETAKELTKQAKK